MKTTYTIKLKDGLNSEELVIYSELEKIYKELNEFSPIGVPMCKKVEIMAKTRIFFALVNEININKEKVIVMQSGRIPPL